MNKPTKASRPSFFIWSLVLGLLLMFYPLILRNIGLYTIAFPQNTVHALIQTFITAIGVGCVTIALFITNFGTLIVRYGLAVVAAALLYVIAIYTSMLSIFS